MNWGVSCNAHVRLCVHLQDIRMTAASTQDGAFAWLLCTMSFLNHVIIGGFIYASGIFYLMFKNSLNVTDSEVSLITSINVGVMHGIGPFVGILCERFGSHCVAVAGAAITTAGLACSAFSTQIIHLYISYGVIAGAGQGVIMIISIAVLDPYFYKYKRTACSIALMGFGVGTFIVPPMLTYLEDIYGWRGAILLLAGINAHMMVTCSLFRPIQKQNLQPQDTIISQAVEKSFDNGIPLQFKAVPNTEGGPGSASTIKSKAVKMLSLFKVTPFVCMSTCNFISVFSTSIIMTHFGSYLLTLQFTSEDVVKLYMTLGVGATVTRPLMGIVAEVTQVNSALYITLTLVLNGMLTMFVPFMKQLWMMYLYAVLYQLLSGPYLALGATTIMEHVPRSQVATAYGVYIFVCVPGYVLGGPMGVWLYHYTQVYGHIFYLAGGLIILSGLTMAPAAYYIHKKIISR